MKGDVEVARYCTVFVQKTNLHIEKNKKQYFQEFENPRLSMY